MRRWLLLFFTILLIVLGTPPGAAQEEGAGVQVGIARPGEEETFYAGPDSLLYSMTVTGWALSVAHEADELAVILEIVQDGAVTGALHTRPRSDGTYKFSLTVNPHGLPLNVPDPTCLHCHYTAGTALPPGRVEIRVTARTPEGEQAVASRQIIVDIGTTATIPVRVIGEDDGMTLPEGLPVTAAAWIYSWRARYGTATTTGASEALVTVEALAEAPATYALVVPPTVRDGLIYESVAPVYATVAPAARRAAPVILRVGVRSGSVWGTISPVPETAIPVRAIRERDGRVFETTCREGAFHFDNLPIAAYVVAPDPVGAASAGLSAGHNHIDLRRTSSLSTTLALAAVHPFELALRISGDGGSGVPFAWITLEHHDRVQGQVPGTETVRLYDLSGQALTLIVSAPGYYSQAHALTPGDADVHEVQLVANPATETVALGSGEVVVPPETTAARLDGGWQLTRGWLWGTVPAGHTLPLTVGPVTVREISGSFAVEYLPGDGGWFYLLDGEATIHQAGGMPVALHAGEMVALGADGPLQPVTLDPFVVSMLNEEGAKAPVAPRWQPAFSAQIRDRLARAGVTTVQLITFVTYISILLSLLAVPAVVLYWWWREERDPPKIDTQGEW